jgi:hypothetical protein
VTTGRRPFCGRSDVETLTLVRDSACPRPSEVVAGYPPALERIVMRALHKRPEDRYPSARAVQLDLERFVRERKIAISSSSLGVWMQSMFKDRMDAHSQHKRDVIAAQQRRWAEGAVDSGTSASLSLAPSSKASELELSTAPSKWRMRAAWALVGFGAVAAMGIVVYLARGIQHEMAVRTELLRAYHEEQAFRPATPQEPEVTGALEMTSKPVGAAIWINGTLRAEVTPATIDKLSLDRELHIKIVKDGFEAFRTTTRLTDESPFKESDADMKPIPATVIVHVDPPEKSAVWIDGKPWRGDHWVIEGVSPGVEHWLIIAAPGYVARMASLTPLAGETRALSVHLVKAGH